MLKLWNKMLRNILICDNNSRTCSLGFSDQSYTYSSLIYQCFKICIPPWSSRNSSHYFHIIYGFRINPSKCATSIGVVVGIFAIIIALGFGPVGIGASALAWLMAWWEEVSQLAVLWPFYKELVQQDWLLSQGQMQDRTSW